jgi:hypothetical protein
LRGEFSEDESITASEVSAGSTGTICSGGAGTVVIFSARATGFSGAGAGFSVRMGVFSDRTGTLSALTGGFSALAGFPPALLVGLFFLTATGAGFLRTTFLAGRDVFLEGGDTDRRGLAAFLIAFFAIFLFR